MTAKIDDIIENFALLDEWDDRYRYVIELGRTLEPLPEELRSEHNKVQGCASQVWLGTTVKPNGASGPTLSFVGDSDAHIVRGLIAILFALYSGKPAPEILNTDAVELFNRLGPIVQALDPKAVNTFLDAIVQALDGNTDKIRQSIDSLAVVAQSLGSRDQAIGHLIDNVNTVAGAITDRDANAIGSRGLRFPCDV